MKEKQTILVVDDLEANRKMISTLITPMGYVIVEAANGEEALQQFQDHRPDLLILDLNMPKMDGYEVCRRLKSNSETMAVPIMVITGLGDDQAHLKALELGANDFLAKPFNIHFLKAKLKSLLLLKSLYLRELPINSQDLIIGKKYSCNQVIGTAGRCF